MEITWSYIKMRHCKGAAEAIPKISQECVSKKQVVSAFVHSNPDMMLKKIPVIVFMWVLPALKIHAQLSSAEMGETQKLKPNHYLSAALAFTGIHYKDETNSPLTYNTSGFPIGTEISFDNRSKNHSGYSKIFFSSQLLNTEVAPGNANPSEDFLTFQFSTSRVWNVAGIRQNRIRYRLGYSGNFNYNHQINYRLGNAAYTYAIFFNGGVANRFEFPFTLKTEKKWWFVKFRQPEQHFNLNWQVNIPLAGAITRPNYAGIRHFANGEFSSNLSREMTDHIEFTSLHNFFILHSQLELWAPLGNNNKLKIAYQWDGFRYYGQYTPVQSTMWSIQVGLMFKIDSRAEMDQITKQAEK